MADQQRRRNHLKKVYYENDMIASNRPTRRWGLLCAGRHVQVQGKVVMVLRRLN
jgi:hypothetical protein